MPDSPSQTALRDHLVRQGLRFSQLRLLVALSETGQMSGAAAQLAITQPAASRLMAELERIVGAPIYSRHARGVTLTETGALLAATARDILRQLDDTRDAVQSFTRGARGLVRIGAVTGPSLEIVLPVIRDLRVTYPEIELTVNVETSDKLAESLLSHDIDFYIGRLPDGVDARAFEMCLIGPEPVALMVKADHPLTRIPGVTLEDCLVYDWVMQPPGGLQRRTVETYLLENGYRVPKRVLGTASLLLTLALVADTNAVAPVTRSVGEFYAERSGLGGNIRLLDVAPDMSVSPYSLVRLADHRPSPPVARVYDLIAASAARHIT
ncbi:LysR family transcriptional regulator [uncultured Maritimibacter sp.]|jgi:DNA-binding transcriptional LysR family regulator|uniref:LysR family transcriptional regulator n=1 Tax=uncultured Maritimibacter sp. TaxID=991866 RepID=UPI000A6EBB39|nr:LysR family transcriptional regulator [uncultured Maritimibacter sp.]